MRAFVAVVAILLLVAPVGAGQDTERRSDLSSLLFAPRPVEAGPQCVAGVKLDDGTFENGLRTSLVSDARFVQSFTPPSYPSRIDQVCVCWTTGLDPATMGFAVIAYDDNGPGTTPGTFLGSKTNVVSIPTAFGELWVGTACSDLNLTVASGAVFLGAQWNAAANPDFFICTDESLSTPQAQAYRSSNAGISWLSVSSSFPETRALGVRAEFTSATPPPPPPPPPPPTTGSFTSALYPNFKFWVRVSTNQGFKLGKSITPCPPQTLCVASVLPTRADHFIRILGPAPGNKFRPQILRYSLQRTEVWIQQISPAKTIYYDLPVLPATTTTLPGVADVVGFTP